MAKRAPRQRAPAAAEESTGSGTAALDRIAGLLALLVTKDMEKEDAAVRLGGVGFSDREIAILISEISKARLLVQGERIIDLGSNTLFI